MSIIQGETFTLPVRQYQDAPALPGRQASTTALRANAETMQKRIMAFAPGRAISRRGRYCCGGNSGYQLQKAHPRSRSISSKVIRTCRKLALEPCFISDQGTVWLHTARELPEWGTLTDIRWHICTEESLLAPIAETGSACAGKHSVITSASEA